MEVTHSTKRHTHTIIFLHGRDSNATEFMSDIFESQGSDDKTFPETFENIKWVFPTAPEIVSARFGEPLSQWFDMWTTENPLEQQESPELSSQVERIHEIIRGEAAIAVLSGSMLCSHKKHRLAGFLGLSSWLTQEDKLRTKANATALSTPVFLGHTKDDDVIDICYGEDLRDKLMDMGMKVTWCKYEDGGHWVNEPKGVDDMVTFVNKAIDKAGK